VRKLASNNSTGYTGVTFNKNRNSYIAYISLKGRRQYLGLFKTLEEAIAARKAAEPVKPKPIVKKRRITKLETLRIKQCLKLKEHLQEEKPHLSFNSKDFRNNVTRMKFLCEFHGEFLSKPATVKKLHEPCAICREILREPRFEYRKVKYKKAKSHCYDLASLIKKNPLTKMRK
jgi:hypothetical protein